MKKRRKIPTLTREEYLDIFHSEKVRVYFNLHKKLFSVKSKRTGLVLFHTKEILLRDVTYRVYESGRQRVLKERKKNVHAYVDGMITAKEVQDHWFYPVTYNPYKYDSFVMKNRDTAKVTASDYAFLKEKRIYAY